MSKFLTVEGNHDCDIKTCMWYINSDQIVVLADVEELERLNCHLAFE